MNGSTPHRWAQRDSLRSGWARVASPCGRLLVAALASLLLAALGVSAASGSAMAAPRTAPHLPPSDVSAWLAQEMALLARRDDVPGLVCATVTGRDQDLARSCTGHATTPAGVLDTRRTLLPDGHAPVFRVGSVTKVLTALAVEQLAASGKVSLSADVRGYLDFPIDEHRGQVTLRDLLDSDAGYEERISDADRSTASGLQDLRSYLATNPPRQVWAPGTMPAYSNWSVDLAGYVVQRVTGQPFQTYLDAHVTTPLAMTSCTTRQPLPADMAAHLPGNITRAGRPGIGFEYINDGPAGAATCSLEDLARLARFLLGHPAPAVLAPADLTALTAATPDPRLGALTQAGYMSMALEHSQYRGEPAIGHDGETLATTADLMTFPRQRLALVIVANSKGHASQLQQDLVAAFASRYVHPGPEPLPAPTTGAKDRAHAVAGRWQTTRRSTTTPMAFIARQESTIAAGPDGTISLDGQTLHEIHPWVWADNDRIEIVAARQHHGHVDAVTTWPTVTMTPAPLLDTKARLTVLTGAGAASLVALAILVVTTLLRIRRRRPRLHHILLLATAPIATLTSLALFVRAANWTGGGLDLVPDMPMLRAAQVLTLLALTAAAAQIILGITRLAATRCHRAFWILALTTIPSLTAGLIAFHYGLLNTGTAI